MFVAHLNGRSLVAVAVALTPIGNEWWGDVLENAGIG